MNNEIRQEFDYHCSELESNRENIELNKNNIEANNSEIEANNRKIQEIQYFLYDLFNVLHISTGTFKDLSLDMADEANKSKIQEIIEILEK